MAQVDPEHVPTLTMGFFTLLIAATLGLAVLNHYADH
jgi:hypothetical protein